MCQPAKRQPLMSWQFTFFAGRTAEFSKAYPATDFSNGITDLTIKLAAERVGLAFLFVVRSQDDTGWIILSKALQQKDCTSKLKKVIGDF